MCPPTNTISTPLNDTHTDVRVELNVGLLKTQQQKTKDISHDSKHILKSSPTLPVRRNRRS